jgi:undecaprenyl-diphosphatase
VITGVAGVIMSKAGLRLPHSALPIALAAGIGGVLFILVERMFGSKETNAEISWAVALAMAAGQVLAIAFPGTSRSGATILFALLLGTTRPAAIEFSFLLGIPTLCAAGAKTLWDAHKAGVHIEWMPLGIASLAAAISSVFAVRWLISYVRNHTFVGFGWYRIALAIVVLASYFAGFLH